MTTESSVYEFSRCRGKSVKELLSEDEVLAGRFFVCGGAGLCGACKAEIISGEVYSEGRVYSKGTVVRMCRSEALSDRLRIMVPPGNSGLDSGFAEADFNIPSDFAGEAFEGVRAAVDIGTTTLALALFDASANILCRQTAVNPQCKYGADVVSRIAFAMSPGGLNILRKCVADSIGNMLFAALQKAGADSAQTLYVSGNCAMLHIFFERDISGLASFPFRTDFLRSLNCASFMGIKAERIVSLPSMGAFVGADAVAACVNVGLFSARENSVMIDLGTNAEIVVKYKGKIFSCSAPAGPAFEGGGFESSVKAQNGAICSVYQGEGAHLKYATIGGFPPCGICASGYIDFLAVARDAGIISAFGAFENGGKCYNFTDSVRICRAEISELIKAKAAVQSALKTIFSEIGAADFDFFHVYIAGGFGKGMNFSNAIKIGLLPPFRNALVESVGNAALGGAVMCALSGKIHDFAAECAAKAEVVELNMCPSFQDNFIDAMSLGEVDAMQ